MKTVGILGNSHVGAHVANSLLWMGAVDRLILSDKNETLCKGQVNDFLDAMCFYPHNVQIEAVGDNYEALAEADVIVNAAGHVAAAAGNRDGELYVTSEETKTFAKRIVDAGFDGVWVSVSNPNDVIVTEIWGLTEYDPKKIIGAGTTLDSARLKHALAKDLGVDAHSISAWMLGEHGFSEFACFSHASFGTMTLDEIQKQLGVTLDLDDLEERALKGGYITYEGKQCTEYAIANSTAQLVQAVLTDAKFITPASTLLEDVYGESGIFSSLPVLIGKEGIEQVFVPEFNEVELEKWHRTCAHIRENVEKIKCW